MTLGRLIFAAVALVLISVTTAILTAAGKAAWTGWLVAPLPLAALAGHLLLVPRYGAVGASLVTLATAAAGASACVVAVRYSQGFWPPPGTCLRSAVAAAALIYALATALPPAVGPLLPLKLAALAATGALTLALLGEFTTDEFRL
ncbi:MAG: polysaccharide biosynthesis C-terminal domain-containing protein, partial [Pyrinomonadaceae bacterium]